MDINYYFPKVEEYISEDYEKLLLKIIEEKDEVKSEFEMKEYKKLGAELCDCIQIAFTIAYKNDLNIKLNVKQLLMKAKYKTLQNAIQDFEVAYNNLIDGFDRFDILDKLISLYISRTLRTILTLQKKGYSIENFFKEHRKKMIDKDAREEIHIIS